MSTYPASSLLTLLLLCACSCSDTAKLPQGEPNPTPQRRSTPPVIKTGTPNTRLLPTQPACAKEQGSRLGSMLTVSWKSLPENAPLIVLVSADWDPSMELFMPDIPKTQALLDASRFEVIAKPYATFIPEDHRAFGPCREGAACPLALVKLSLGELDQWIQTSCDLKFVELTAFDCLNLPEACEDATSCPLVSSQSLDAPNECIWSNVGGCQSSDEVCFQRNECLDDRFGNPWLFNDSCIPEGGYHRQTSSCLIGTPRCKPSSI